MNGIFKIVQQGQVFAVQSSKSESGQVNKCNLVLQELGGKYENQYLGTLLGNAATARFYPDELVAAALKFTTREHNGAVYQDILVTEIHKIKV